MSSIKSNNQEPKLYLHQPKLTKPDRKMQSFYHAKHPLNDSDEMSTEDHGEEIVEDRSSSKKRFKDMTILEKIEHFSRIPSYLPRVRCEIITERKKYYGYILGSKSNMALVQTVSKEEEISVPIEQITEINLIGF